MVRPRHESDSFKPPSFYLFDPLPRISKAVSSRTAFIKSISSIPTAHNQVIFRDLRTGGGTQYKFKRPLSFFAHLSLALNPDVSTAATSFHQPTNGKIPQKRGVPNKTTLPRSAVVRYYPIAFISRYPLFHARSPPPFVDQTQLKTESNRTHSLQPYS